MRTKLNLLVFLSSLFVAAQAPAIQWQKTFGGSSLEFGRIILQTSDGGYVIADTTNSNDGDVSGYHGGGDIWVAKTDSLGNIIWTKTLGGTDSEFVNSIKQTTDGGYVIAGQTSSTNGDISGFNGGFEDVWIVKLDSLGNLLWQKALGGTSSEESGDIVQTTDGGYIVACSTYSNNGNVSGNHGSYDFWVVKLNSLGTVLWQKALGGTSAEYARSIQQTTDGGYIIAGYTSSNDGNVSGYHGNVDFWIVKLNNLGVISWQKTFGGTSQDLAQSVQQTADGGFIVAGQTLSNNGDVTNNQGTSDCWIIKLTNLGTISWQKTFGGNNNDSANRIENTIDGGYIFIGRTESNNGDVVGNHGTSDAWVVKLNQTGQISWQKTLGGTFQEYGRSIQQTSDGGYIIATQTYSTDGDVSANQGNSDFWAIKLNATLGNQSFYNQHELKLYPNPATSIINIDVQDSKVIKNLVFTDIMGKEVLKQNTPLLKSNNISVNIENFQVGLYFVKIETEEKTKIQMFSKK
jgi:Secretion system C-terminal sorting domain